MQITFPESTATDRTVEINESDLPTLYGAIRDCFINRMQTYGLENPFWDFETSLAGLCKRYGIDSHNRKDTVSFFQALLIGHNGAQHDVRNEIEIKEATEEAPNKATEG